MREFNTVFMGTPEFAVPSLNALCDSGSKISLVVTRPDRPRGRGRRLAQPPVKKEAEKRGLTVVQPEAVDTQDFYDMIRRLEPDVFVVIAFGKILPKRLLEMPSMGAVNLHASVLPGYRGPAPIQWAIINGDKETGVTSMLMDAGLDTGEILLSRTTPIYDDETAGSLHDRLSLLAADVLIETLQQMSKGTIRPIPQDHARASYAPMLKKSDGRLDWTWSAKYLERFIRGMSPWPCAFTYWGNTRLNIYRAEVRPCPRDCQPATVIEGFADELRVAAGKDALSILEIQAESGKRMNIRDFLKGSSIPPGTVLK